MKTRLFKPGDRVQLKSGGPVMIVQKYPLKYGIFGWHEDPYSVECTWVDSKKGYQRSTFLVRKLVRSKCINTNKLSYHPAMRSSLTNSQSQVFN